MIDLLDIPCLYGEVDKSSTIILTDRKNAGKISIQSDIMFKSMFQNESRIKYPMQFLDYLFSKNNKYNFSNLRFSKNEIDKKHIKDKSERYDFVTTLGDITFNIEVNNNSDVETMERNIEYANHIYSGKIKIGKKYSYSPVVQININSFAFKESDKTIDVFYNRNDEGLALTNKQIFIMIYIPNIKKKWYTSGIESLTDFERFMLVLALEDNDKCFEIAKGNKIMEEYIKDATEVSFDYSFGESYDHIQADIDESFKDGRYDATVEIAKNMLLEDSDISYISKVTKLSISNINELKEEIDKQ